MKPLATKPKSKRGGRGGSATAPTNRPRTSEDIINEALGERGTPNTIKESIDAANPNWRADRNYQINCQRVVWAVEMNRRGFDVEALPYNGDSSYCKADKSFAKSYANVAEGGLSFDTVQGFWNVPATDFKAHFTDKYDVGARGAIRAQNSKTGHVFNWEIVQGKNGKRVVFYDGQPNGVKGVDNVSVSSMKKKWYFFQEARMDNVKVTPLIAEYVKPKK